MQFSDFVRLDGVDRQQLLRRAACIAEHLPQANGSDDTWVTCAFGEDIDALAASIVACWLKGHGAAVVENTLRDRIKPVVDDERTVMLLHDTGSGRHLQVTRMLADATLPDTPTQLPSMDMATAIAVHVQGNDGEQTWCTWSPAELTDALDALPAESTSEMRTYSPGFLPALFHNCLRALRGGIDWPSETPVDVRPGIQRAPAVVADTLPPTAARDVNGQVLFADHHLAQGLGRKGQPIERELQFAANATDDDTAVVTTRLPSNYLFFEGHFEGYPVIAGGVQLHQMMLPALRALCGELPDVQGLDGVKFVSRMAPGDTVDIKLQRSDDGRRVSFEFATGDTRCTVGRMTFAAEVPPFSTER